MNNFGTLHTYKTGLVRAQHQSLVGLHHCASNPARIKLSSCVHTYGLGSGVGNTHDEQTAVSYTKLSELFPQTSALTLMTAVLTWLVPVLFNYLFASYIPQARIRCPVCVYARPQSCMQASRQDCTKSTSPSLQPYAVCTTQHKIKINTTHENSRT